MTTKTSTEDVVVVTDLRRRRDEREVASPGP